MDPTLRNLERFCRSRAAEAARKRNRCGNAAWYGYGAFRGLSSPREQLVFYVGWRRERPPAARTTPEQEAVLCSSAAYDAAYRHLYEMMPDCTDCACL
jgi:hypothetical protein